MTATSNGRRDDIHFDTPPRVWMTRKELAERWALEKSTLATWATLGKGPCFAKIGRYPRYLLSDVEAWEDQQRVEPGKPAKRDS